jgi:hypothetical protein
VPPSSCLTSFRYISAHIPICAYRCRSHLLHGRPASYISAHIPAHIPAHIFRCTHTLCITYLTIYYISYISANISIYKLPIYKLLTYIGS